MSLPTARRRFLLLLLATGLPGCAAFPGADSGLARVEADAFVVFTSPVQVPAMAGRDAYEMVDGPWLSVLSLPVTFPLQFLRHTGLTALHLLDLTAAPLHFLSDAGEPEIYRRDVFPMVVDEDAPVAREAGEMALWGAAMWGGIAVSYWLIVDFVPALFSLF
jgi:hypothetical protein